MAFPSSALPANQAMASVLNQLQIFAAGIKQQAASASATAAANSVNTAFIFSMLDQLSGVIATLNTYKSVAGLNAYATANIPGYAGTLTTDITAVINAAQACITWVSTNFPKDAGGFIQAYTLNADGTRTMASFSTAQTVGLQTALNALVATIT